MQPLTRRYYSHLRGGTRSISRRTTRQSLTPSSLNNSYSFLPVCLVRRNHDVTRAPRASQSRNANADAIVVGGGAAGIAVVGNLLQAIPRGKIVWIDRSFDGGSIGQLYREIPSYSPASDFLQYAQALTIFRDICDAAPKPNVIGALQDLDPEITCPLTYAADMLTLISDGLIQHPRVQPVLGTVTHAVRNPKTRHWQTTLTPNHDIGNNNLPNTHNHNHNHNPQTQHHTAPLLVYATGTRPRTTDLPLPLSRLTLDTCLSPTRLARLLPADRPCTVAVVGDGHAAVLVLRNLMGLVGLPGVGGLGTHPLVRVRWFTRGIGDGGGVEGGVGGSEFAGLQGEAARFAQTMLEGERLAESGAGEFITRFSIPPMQKGISEMERAVLEGEAIKKDLEGVDYVVQDAGFRRTRLPEVRPGLGVLGGPVGKAKHLVFNASTGSFYPNGASRDKVLGLFGAGSAFPEGQRSVEASGQLGVGVWNFMQSLQRLVPRWVLATKKGRLPRIEDWDRERFGGRAHEYY